MVTCCELAHLLLSLLLCDAVVKQSIGHTFMNKHQQIETGSFCLHSSGSSATSTGVGYFDDGKGHYFSTHSLEGHIHIYPFFNLI